MRNAVRFGELSESRFDWCAECLNHKYVFGTPLAVSRLVHQVADKAQKYTQKAEKRPYGVGLLVAGTFARLRSVYSLTVELVFILKSI